MFMVYILLGKGFLLSLGKHTRILGDEMQEKRTIVIPIQVTLICDCGKEMEPTGDILLSMPQKYVYHCLNCKNTNTTTEVYPRIIYEDKK